MRFPIGWTGWLYELVNLWLSELWNLFEVFVKYCYLPWRHAKEMLWFMLQRNEWDTRD